MELKLFWDVLKNYCKTCRGSTRLMTGTNRLGLHCRVLKLGPHLSLPGGDESMRCINLLQIYSIGGRPLYILERIRWCWVTLEALLEFRSQFEHGLQNPGVVS